MLGTIVPTAHANLLRTRLYELTRQLGTRLPVYVTLSKFDLLEGYHGEYQDKIPLNRFGVAPVIIPSVGAYYGPVAAELVLLGFNAAMVTTGLRF